MYTIIYDTWGERQIGWLVFEDNKVRYRSLKKDSLMLDAKGGIHLGKFGSTIGKKERTDLRKVAFEKMKKGSEEEQEELWLILYSVIRTILEDLEYTLMQSLLTRRSYMSIS